MKSTMRYALLGICTALAVSCAPSNDSQNAERSQFYPPSEEGPRATIDDSNEGILLPADICFDSKGDFRSVSLPLGLVDDAAATARLSGLLYWGSMVVHLRECGRTQPGNGVVLVADSENVPELSAAKAVPDTLWVIIEYGGRQLFYSGNIRRLE